MTMEEWVKTLRERTHRLSTDVTTLNLKTEALTKRIEEMNRDLRRYQPDLAKRVTALAEEVKRMANADEISEGVAREIAKRDEVQGKKVDTGMRRLVWFVGIVLTLLQIANIFLR